MLFLATTVSVEPKHKPSNRPGISVSVAGCAKQATNTPENHSDML